METIAVYWEENIRTYGLQLEKNLCLARVDILGPWSIATVLQLEQASLRYGTTVVVISPVINDRLRRTLMDLHRREHAVTLIALGEADIADPLPGIRMHHIGMGKEWRELEALELAG